MWCAAANLILFVEGC